MGLSLLNLPEAPLIFRFTVPADPVSLKVVRRSVNAVADVCGQDVADRLAVIFSELVTNAIRHAGVRPEDTLEVTLDIGPKSICGKVVDSGTGFSPEDVPPRGPEEEGGFGLKIVDELASLWGVERTPHPAVWFQI